MDITATLSPDIGTVHIVSIIVNGSSAYIVYINASKELYTTTIMLEDTYNLLATSCTIN